MSKVKYLVIKPVASYKFGDTVEFEEGKLPLALSSHVVRSDSVAVSSDSLKAEIKALKAENAALKKSAKQGSLEVATPVATKK